MRYPCATRLGLPANFDWNILAANDSLVQAMTPSGAGEPKHKKAMIFHAGSGLTVKELTVTVPFLHICPECFVKTGPVRTPARPGTATLRVRAGDASRSVAYSRPQ
jgi:hypothetical protein